MPGWPIGARGSRARSAIPLATVEKVLRLYKETYYDLNIRHFHEKLRDEHAHRVELHVGTESAARSRAGSQAAQAGTAPAATTAAAACRGCCCTSTAASIGG